MRPLPSVCLAGPIEAILLVCQLMRPEVMILGRAVPHSRDDITEDTVLRVCLLEGDP